MSINEEILLNITPQETRVAIVENGALQEVSIERQRSRGIVGNIYKGKVNRVLPGMDAEIAKQTQRILTKQGLAFSLGRKVLGADTSGAGVTLRVEPSALVSSQRSEMTRRSPVNGARSCSDSGRRPGSTPRTSWAWSPPAMCASRPTSTSRSPPS